MLYCRKLTQQQVSEPNGLVAQSQLITAQHNTYECNLYILFANASCDSSTLEQPKVGEGDDSPTLLEHHLGILLSSDLPDIDSLKYMIRDHSDDLNDILNTLDHVIKLQEVRLPLDRQVKNINWRAKLIIAELRDWAKGISKEAAMIGFKEMLQGLKLR